MRKQWSRIFDSELDFNRTALWVYRLQFEHNPVYRRFCKALGILKQISHWREIPLLPIEAFKETSVTTDLEGESAGEPLLFQSSGTGSMQRSQHLIPDPNLYQQSIREGFTHAYPNLKNPIFWAYLPHYVDNPHSSLVYMMKELISDDPSGESRFLPLNEPLDPEALARISGLDRPIILFGAAFGLLDLLEDQDYQLPENSLIMETGGMKTYRREMTREEMHRRFSEGFGIAENRIHSEYGMAELVSQSYSKGDSWFETPPWMKVTIQDPDDPTKALPAGEEGLIGIRDLGNLYSCAFLLTGDKGVQDDDGRFQVLGRWNPSDLRGCNFLIEEEQ